MMKTLAIIGCFMLLMASCQPSKLEESSNDEETILINTAEEEETTLLNVPVDKVNLTVGNETFTVDFRIDDFCQWYYFYYMDYEKIKIEPPKLAELKTRDDLINLYKTFKPFFQPGYSSMMDWVEMFFVRVEYILAQECFSDLCDSKTRKEVLQLASNFQRGKYNGEYTLPWCTQKTGVFLMAVILVKEREVSAKYIDAVTLQQALLCLNSDNFESEEFSNLITERSEKFLDDKK